MTASLLTLRRAAPVLFVVLVLLLAAACAPDDEVDDPVMEPPEEEPDEPVEEEDVAADYEVWALDQGTDTVYVLDADGEVTDEIDLGAEGVETPHMIDFDSEHRYAFIANTGSGDVAVVRTEDREVVDVVETGETAHMAAVTPDDATVWVANIGAETLTEITVDYDAEEFTVDRELSFPDDDTFVEATEDSATSASPICHQYTDDSRYAYVTFGPEFGAAGLAVVDLDELVVERVYPGEEIPANCGVMASDDGEKMYVNGGAPATEDDPDPDDGQWWVFDTSSHELIGEGSTEGIEAHGVALSPDGSELWMVNRSSSDGVVIDTETDEVVDTIADTGPSPDILWFEPNGERVYLTLRGPEPRSGPHAIAGDTPGVAVLDAGTRELIEVRELDEGNEDSDFHGLAVRPL